MKAERGIEIKKSLHGAFMVLVLVFGYALFYFNYFETPTADFIGQHRVLALGWLKGDAPLHNPHGFMPVYHMVLAFFTLINPFSAHDKVYLTAMLLNICLYVPYVIITFLIYRRFLSRWTGMFAVLFLGLNIFTVYTAVNSELEMLLSLLIVLTIYLTLKNSRWAYFTSFFAASTKWDSVFAVPAAMFRDFFFHKKRVVSMVLGGLASTGAVALFVASMWYGNVYVKEIAGRGPCTYEYLVDTILTISGYMAWMGTDAYFSKSLAVQLPAYVFALLTGIFIITAITWGVVLLVRRHRHEAAPVMVFVAGFVIVHMVYQNTKERYVMPLLWAWFLFLFYGLSEGLYPWLLRKTGSLSLVWTRRAVYSLSAVAVVAYITGWYLLWLRGSAGHWIFAVLFTLAALWLVRNGIELKNLSARILLVLCCGVIINFSVVYGLKAMDHYSLRRVEFKKAGIWFREHYTQGEKLLITEVPVTAYYARLDRDSFIPTASLRSKDLDSLVRELRGLGADYIFIDDFYIRRLRVNDKNAIDKKAPLLLLVREKGKDTGHFKPVAAFETRGGIKSYMYRFIP